MTSHAARRAAAAVARQVPRKTMADPKARGADWRTATVATISATAGTITTTDGIPARRMQTYQNPAVGDQVVISRAGNGNWIAAGRLAAADGWLPLSLASGWTVNTAYFTPAAFINSDGTASLCGLAQMSGTLTAGATVATLPAAATPTHSVRASVQVATGFFAVMTLNNTGAVTLGDFSATLPTTGTKWAEFDCLDHYRLS